MGSTFQWENAIWPMAAWVLCIRAMLFYSYKSTDFEVHRNWMAVTHSLPLCQWYSDATSQWTLDYPPLFAYFEWVLSWPAKCIEPAMLTVQSRPYESAATTLYMRSTVFACDVIYTLVAIRCVKSPAIKRGVNERRSSVRQFSLAVLLVGHAGLVLVDSVHFQYNGILSALLLMSLCALMEHRFYAAAFWYFFLVNMKHIYLYLAPAYAMIYLKSYCFTPADKGSIFGLFRRLNLVRCFLLALIAIFVFAVSFGPFVYAGQLSAVLGRLFPVGRGLTHAYWAPNIWSLYLTLDYFLRTVLARLAGSQTAILLAKFLPEWMPPTIEATLVGKLPVPQTSYTSGLVQVHSTALLPNVGPVATAVCAALLCLVVGVVGKCGNRFHGIDAVVAAAFTCYMFGYHVHEKAILLVTLPLAIGAMQNRTRARWFILISTIAHFSLFPLFNETAEMPVKYGVTFLFFAAACVCLKEVHGDPNSKFVPFISWLEFIYLVGFIPLEVYNAWGHFFLAHNEWIPFLPLMATSVYCALGMVYSYVRYMNKYVLIESSEFYSRLIQWRWRSEQDKLSRKLITTNTQSWQDDPKFAGLQYVAGVDIATAAHCDQSAAVSIAVVHFPSLELLHSEVFPMEIDTPYVPGYLAFREAAPMCEAVRRAAASMGGVIPQVVLVDGNGLLHPRKFGSACHVGIQLDLPTVGVAKNLHHVAGLYRDPSAYQRHLHKRGDSMSLTVQQMGGDCELGRAVLLGDQVGSGRADVSKARNPSFVSVGHRIDLDSAERLALTCSRHRVPEPIRHADFIARRAAEAWYDE